MTQDNNNILKGMKTAVIIGLFYGSLVTMALGAFFMIVVTLVVCLVTLFNAKGVWAFVLLGAYDILVGFIVAAIGYLLTIKCDIDPNGPPKLLKNVMLPVMAISGFLTTGMILLSSALIYGWYVLY